MGTFLKYKRQDVCRALEKSKEVRDKKLLTITKNSILIPPVNIVSNWIPMPSGPIKSGGQATSPIQGYSMHTSQSAGIIVKDVTRCGSIQFSIVE